MSATWRGSSAAARSKWGSAACAQYSRPSTLSSTICCHSGMGAPATGPSSITPALLISVSRRPSFATVRCTAAVACCSSVMSHSSTSAVPPWSLTLAAASPAGPRAAPPARPPRLERRARPRWPRRSRSKPRSPARRCHPVRVSPGTHLPCLKASTHPTPAGTVLVGQPAPVCNSGSANTHRMPLHGYRARSARHPDVPRWG